MVIRPIDFQNLILRAGNISKQVAEIINSKKIDNELKKKEIAKERFNHKDRIIKIENIHPDESRVHKIKKENVKVKQINEQKENNRKSINRIQHINKKV